MGIEDWFGGLTGKAVKDLKKRKSRLEQAEDEAMGVATDEPSQTYKDGANSMRKEAEENQKKKKK